MNVYHVKITTFQPRLDSFRNKPISMDSHSLINRGEFNSNTFDEISFALKNLLNTKPNFDTNLLIKLVDDPDGKTVYVGDSEGEFNARFEWNFLPQVIEPVTKKETGVFNRLLNLFSSPKPVEVKTDNRYQKFNNYEELITAVKTFFNA